MTDKQVREILTVYERQYDNPVGDDGKKKPNRFLGKFRIKQILMEDFYAGRWIAERGKKTYLITQTEVSGLYNPEQGGSRWTTEEIATLSAPQVKEE